jgi:hypothetical protein
MKTHTINHLCTVLLTIAIGSSGFAQDLQHHAKHNDLPSEFRGFFLTPVVLNEYNAVGSEKWLGNPGKDECEGPDGEDCADNEDTFYGRVIGNGGDWMELLVIEDHLDLRGAEIFWAEPDQDETEADGTNMWFISGTIEQGIITLSDDPVWSDLRAGTVITLTDLATTDGGLDTDLSYDPCNGDWWININTHDTQYATAESNLIDAEPGHFHTGNDMWFCFMMLGTEEIFPPTGEGADIWGGQWPGGGINSREVMRLEEGPCNTEPFLGLWDDGKQSTYGSPNKWNVDFEKPGGIIVECRTYQDFECLRATVMADCDRCATLILNEYNAVSSGAWLNGGDEDLDEDGGQATDSFFGRTRGNGGDWMEFVVITDHLDIRNWSFEWLEVDDGNSGMIKLSDDPVFSDLRSGTIVTITEWSTAQGGLDSTIGDTWINLNSNDIQYVAYTTGSDDDHENGDFSTSNDNWMVSIHNADGTMMEQAAGEGSPYYYRGGVGNTEVCRLRENPGRLLSANAAYDDASSSTFGSPNTWTECPDDATTLVQDFLTLPDALCVGDIDNPCPSDCVGSDGEVNVNDLLAVIGNWGQPGDCDVNDDDIIDVTDLLSIIAAWGPCD